MKEKISITSILAVILVLVLTGCISVDELVQYKPNVTREGILVNIFVGSTSTVTLGVDLSKNYTYIVKERLEILDTLVVGDYYYFDFYNSIIVGNLLIRIRDSENNTIWYRYG